MMKNVKRILLIVLAVLTLLAIMHIIINWGDIIQGIKVMHGA